MNKVILDEPFKSTITKVIQDSPVLSGIFGCSPDYTYWTDNKGNRWFYTKEKIEHNGKLRYVAGKYRYLKSKKMFKLVSKVGFAKKKFAINWAYEHCYPEEV